VSDTTVCDRSRELEAQLMHIDNEAHLWPRIDAHDGGQKGINLS